MNEIFLNYGIIKFPLISKIFLLPLLIYISFSKLNIIDINLIKVAFYCHSIKYGGVERVISLLINWLYEEKRFSLYLITDKNKLEGEYPLQNGIKRISLSEKNIDLFTVIKKTKLDIFIYNFYDKKEMEILNQLKTTKTIYYDHSSFLIWIYRRYYNFNYTIYNRYKNCKYVISLIPIENDYLFKIWGINSILMDNPTTFEYDSVIASDLKNKNIIMIGRADDPIKRYDLGIKAMKNIIEEIPECIMNIISLINENLEILIKNLQLEKYVRFLGYQRYVEIFLKNASLHILPSLSETYPMVLSETKIFGIPSIICGLDYLAQAKGGTIIIYDDNPNSIAKEAIKILKNYTYRKNLGEEARKSMKKYKNKFIIEKWVKLIISVYNGDKSYQELLLNDNINKISVKDVNQILSNQLKLFEKRNPQFKKLTIENFKSYSFQ